MDIEQTVETINRLVSSYGYAILSVVSPLISWRIVQWYKLLYKRNTGKKPRAVYMDVAGWLIVYVLSLYAWFKHTGDIEGAAFIALLIAIFHTAIVKAIFSYAPKQVTEILQYGADSDHTMLTMFAGKDARSNNREEDITEPRR